MVARTSVVALQALGLRSSRMEFQDRTLKCIDCGADFVFTAGEQLFFHDKQFRNEPKRCKTCKIKAATRLGAAPPQGLPAHTKSRDPRRVLTLR